MSPSAFGSACDWLAVAGGLFIALGVFRLRRGRRWFSGPLVAEHQLGFALGGLSLICRLMNRPSLEMSWTVVGDLLFAALMLGLAAHSFFRSRRPGASR